MVIAFAQIQGFASDDGGLPKFHLTIAASATDGTDSETNPSLTVSGLSASSTTAEFNAAIINAVTTWVNGQHSWSLDLKNLYFQPFRNGS